MGSYEALDNITFSSSKTTYTITKEKVVFEPISANHIICAINGKVQSGNFEVIGSTITFAEAAFSSSDKMDYILHIRT